MRWPTEEELSRARRALVRDLREKGIRDERVLSAIEKVPRHLFVLPEYLFAAYDDRPLPIGLGQTISQPYIVALSTEALELSGEEKVLEIGTGSGYQTAILAELAKEVFTVERLPELSWEAQERLRKLGYTNVHFRVGDGTKGWPEEAPFPAILVGRDPHARYCQAPYRLWIPSAHDLFPPHRPGGPHDRAHRN
jgi:protein-L-isoaspartate(D-aspartate) O-methyltransferase